MSDSHVISEIFGNALIINVILLLRNQYAITWLPLPFLLLPPKVRKKNVETRRVRILSLLQFSFDISSMFKIGLTIFEPINSPST